jgi:hypothetical protein
MKKIILATVILSLAAAGIPKAHAHDHGWSTAGKVLTGLAIASAITCAVAAEPAPVYYSAGFYSGAAPAYGYCTPPAPRVVYVAPPRPPMVVYRAPVYAASAPVYAAPARVAHARFSHGGHRHHHRGCW